MRICHITSMHDWNDDRIFQRACLGLARKGHEVILVATKPADDNIDFSRYPVKFEWIQSRSGIKRRLLSSREAISKAIAVKADVYHFHDPDLLPFIGRLKRKLPKAKVVYDIHENYAGRFQSWGVPKAITGVLYNFFRNYETGKINRIDGFTVVSDSMLKLFPGARKPGIITRNSADLERLRNLQLNGVHHDNHSLIYTSGTQSHARDCLQTVQALPYIVNEFPEAKMMFVGKYVGTIKKDMEDQAVKDGTTDNLVLEGMLPWEQNFIRTSQATCGCVFYADNPNNRVGIPNRLFEYMFTGIPVVASDFPELRNIVMDAQCGVLVDSTNPESIAEGIKSLLRDPVHAKQMGKNGKAAMEEKYGYHVDLQNLETFYHTISDK